MKFAKIIAGLLAAVMLTLSTMSGTSYGNNIASASRSVSTGGFRQQHDPTKEFVYGDFKFAPTDDDGLFLSGIANFDIVDAEIPATVNGKKVTHIDGAAFQDFDYDTMKFIFCEKLKSVTIPSGIISIGEGAFSNCISLESVTIPDTVKEIKFGAFWDCTSLKSITIPKSVTILEIPSGGLFNGCASLTDVYFEGTKEQFETIMLDGAQKLGNDTIWDGTVYDRETGTTRQVTIHYGNNSPNKVINGIKYTLLEDDTYSVGSANSDIRPSSLVIFSEINDKRVTVIEEGAFKNWHDLNGVTIPNTISRISKSAFEGCGTLKSLTIPSSITLIDENAFKNTYLEYVRFEGTKEQWNNIEIKDDNSTLEDALENGRIVFNETMSSDKVIDGVKYTLLEDGTFSVSCNDPAELPEKLVIPSEINDKRVAVIEEGAFSNCENLDTVTLPRSISQIPKSAFENCSRLSAIILPTSITLIDENAFNNTHIETVYFEGSEEQWDAIEIKNGNSVLSKDCVVFNTTTPINPEPNDPDNPDKNTISAPQNVRKGNIYGRIEWDPVEGADRYIITVENTVTDKNGVKQTFAVSCSSDTFGSTENAWCDWAFLAIPYSEETHKIYICAVAGRNRSDLSEPFTDTYTPWLNETIKTPQKVWTENNVLKWDAIDYAAIYWFSILINDEPINGKILHSIPDEEYFDNTSYIDNLPAETYDVEIYVVDKDHIAFNEKT
ncbi:MAG: leucine-rich repeat domain-containing protein, partial [Eubacterium sp.]|nr:leucine-rich repeat domain-containing protein [Eubacterium sp.]